LIFTDGTNNDQSLISYKVRVAPSDALSGTENTSFLSTTGSSANFLHVDGSVASISESGAANIAGFTTDYDNDIRSGNTGYAGTGTASDMGADDMRVLQRLPWLLQLTLHRIQPLYLVSILLGMTTQQVKPDLLFLVR